MISLGIFNGHVMLVNRSNVESELVTYHLYKDGVEIAMSREDAIGKHRQDNGEPYPSEYLYYEAMERYEARGRPPLSEWNEWREKALLELAKAL